MGRSIRVAASKRRQIKTRSKARQLLFEPLEQRRLLSVSPPQIFVPINSDTPALVYGPVQVGSQHQPLATLQPEGEGHTSSAADAARQLLFAGIAGSTSSPANSGLLAIIDANTNSVVPWSVPVGTSGISGLAFNSAGRLFAAIDQGPCTTSELVELNPTDGSVIRRVPIMTGATAINIGDLAFDPATDRLLGTRSIHDDANHAGELFVIDVESGEAAFIGDTGAGSGEALAFAADGTLYLAGRANGKPVLYKIDPETAEPHERDAVTGRAIPFVDVQDPTGRLQVVGGLAGDPASGMLLATGSMTRFAGNQIVDDIYAIDPNTGHATPQPLASPARGIFGDLAFQPSSRALDIVYQENFESGPGGFTIDNSGGTLPGLWHSSVGRRFDGIPSHTPINNFYYGAFETAFGGGHYVLPSDHQGTLTSPLIELPTSSVFSFNYLLDVRPELDVDFVTVSVLTADGNSTQILSRQDGTLPQTGTQQWRTATADLSAFACQPIQLQFSFDTGPAPAIDPEGWYVDDLMIASTGGFCDFGDAPDDPSNPDDYPTLLVSNGARHGIVPGFHLGDAIDAELDGQPTPLADGDDNNPPAGPDDEDGVTFVSALVPGETAHVEVVASAPGLLTAWIDFNGNGNWNEANERIFTDVPLTSGANQLSFTVPLTAVATDLTFSRFRFSTQAGLSYDGLAIDGEVEDHTVTIEAPAPSIDIDKSLLDNADEDGSGDVTVGDTLTYQFEVANTGNQTLTNVLVTDPLPGLSAISPAPVASLAPGATVTFVATYVVLQSDIDDPDGEINNTATVTATDPQGDTQTDMDSEAVMVVDPNPSVAIDKVLFANADEDGSGDVTLGDTLTYHFDVSNDGNQTLTNIFVSDPLPGLSAISPGSVASLAPGATVTFVATYVVVQSDIDDPDGEINNTATVTATDPRGDTQTDMDSEAVMVVDPNPSIMIDKFLFTNADEDGSGTVTLGDTLTYHFGVTNDGNQTLTNILVSDPLPGLSAISPDSVPSLAPGTTVTFVATYVVVQSDIDDPDGEINNTATVTATDPRGDTQIDMDSEAVMVVDPNPSIMIDKFLFSNADEDGSGSVTLGDTLTFHFEVANTGNQTLTNVLLSDPLPGLSTISPDSVPSLAPGDTVTFVATYVVVQSDIDDPDGEINNTATVTATDPRGDTQTDMDSETVIVGTTRNVTIDKFLFSNADEDGSGDVTLGDTLTFHFEVANTGNQTLTNVLVSDPLPGLSAISPGSVPSLAPGATVTFVATYVVVQSDMDNPDGEINNTATVTATDPLGNPLTDMDSETVIVGTTPNITIDKFLFSNADEDGSESVTLGDTLTFHLEVANTGNQTLTNVFVSDPLPGLSDISPDSVPSLAPGATVTFVATYVVVQSDIDDPDGEINNTATVTATDPRGGTQTDMDSEAVMVVSPNPSITIDKFLFSNADEDGSGDVTLGDTLTYHFEVINDGNQTLTNVLVSDPLPGLSAISPDSVPSLAPGASVNFVATYVVVQSDMDDPDGEINNTATVTATDPRGNPVMDTDSETIAVAVTMQPTDEAAPQLVQFITPMSVFRPDGPSEFLNLDDDSRDPNVEVAISGFKWHDLNQDGLWDANEPGRAGWTIFLDVNGDNVLDPQSEPFAITASDGSYVFTVNDLEDLPAGTYAIRDDSSLVSDGTFQIQRFPAPDPGVRDADEHLIQWSPGTVIQGRAGFAETPNFGTFDYSPFIRPADEQLRRFELLPEASKALYLAALRPWQAIDVSNDTNSSFNVVGFDTSMIAAPGNQFVSVVDASGNLVGPENPITVAPGVTVQVYAFYDPAIRNGDTVVEQFPDWLGAKRETNAPHTFAPSDQLTIMTDSEVTVPVALVGASTYDSDIFYDGAVDRRDLARLNDDLLDNGQNWPILEDASSLFDVTSDINNRCPNGAEGVVNTCAWDLLGSPFREVSLGDFGTLNAEFDRARSPFLDLDPDNSSGAKGTDYWAEYLGVPMAVVDSDASFANRNVRVLQELTITAPAGDSLTIEASGQGLPGTIGVTQTETHRLVLTGPGTVEDFLTALSLVRYAPGTTSATRIAEITFVATGSNTAGPELAFTKLENDLELQGNTAVARILIDPSRDASGLL